MWPSRRPRAGSPRALFVTYTMANPFAVGVFFRALRLGRELTQRGWTVVVANNGPLPEDPKMDPVEAALKIVRIVPPSPGLEVEYAYDLFTGFGADIIVFGEEPFPGMDPFYNAARMQPSPLVTLDQFYDLGIRPLWYGVDLSLRYGLEALFPASSHKRYLVIPPFIGEVTARDALPIPKTLRDQPFVSVLGLDPSVLAGGIDLVANLPGSGPAIVTISQDPDQADRDAAKAGIPAQSRLALPLQKDADLFGLIAASHVVVAGNGFMQIVEALALGSPVVGIDRGIGMWEDTLDSAFLPWVSIWEESSARNRRVQAWLKESPFPQEIATQLEQARQGAELSADHIERVARRPRTLSRVQRMSARVRWQATTLFDRPREGSRIGSEGHSS